MVLQVDFKGVSSYLETLKVEGGLYTSKAGVPVTTESLRDGLVVATYTGTNIEKSSVESFLRSLYDSESKLFAPRVGGVPSPKATAEALEIVNLAGIAGRDWTAKVLGEIKAYLPTLLSGGAFVFPASESTGVASSDRELFDNNVYAIVAAQIAGVPLAAHSADLVAHFSERLSARAGFSYAAGTAPSFEATVQAVRALRALERSTHTSIIESLPNREGIMQAIWYVPADLSKVGPAHHTFARLPNMKDGFGISVTLDTPSAVRIDESNPSIVSGTPVTPFVYVAPWGVQPHAGVDVEVTLSHKSGSDKKYKLLFNEERMGFTTEEAFSTESKLGELTATAAVQVPVAGGDVITLKSRVKFNIGYVMNVKPAAKVAGRDIKVGEAVTVGTEFNFEASLSTTAALTSGAFDLVFSVLDSSDVLIAQTNKNYNKQGAETTHFNFELKQANLPAGALTFKFHVLDHATNTIHTSQRYTYDLQLSMVASQIKVGDGASFKPTYKLGETATVSIVPASFPDLVNLHTYAAVDAAGEDASQRRAFYLDTMDAGTVLRSFAGVASTDAQGNVKVEFTVTFPAVFDAIGTHALRFRYAPASGQDVILANYDSNASELLDENVELGFEVNPDLYIADLTDAPKGGSLSYGDLVRFSFKIKDRVTGESVLASYGAASTPIFLALAHKDAAGKSYISARHAISADPRGGFEAQWVVNPNAISGKGTLQLLAVVLGGREIALPTENAKTFGVNVVIGGEISHTAVVKQVSVPTASHAAALVEFTLTCQERRLSGALLTASLLQDGKLVASIPVARSDNEAVYSVSWNIREADAASASYQVAIHRQADTPSSPALITIPVSFEGATTHYLPFRTEALILTTAFISFGVFSYRKYLIERK